MTPAAILQRLLARQAVHEPVLLLAAHPDDEVIGAGAVLPLFEDLLLVHLTDGAPANLADARAYGFSTARAYAAARRAELDRALRLAGLSPRRIELDSPDQGASTRLVPLTLALRPHAAGRVVLTHPYEGGHPDHDAAAFVAARCGRPVLEFASYNAPSGGLRTGDFLPGPTGGPGPGQDVVTIPLDAAEQARKRAMLAAFTTQSATLAPFGLADEPFRPAPAYDFTQPPHGGRLHYERYDWGMTGERWRILAAEAHRALC